MTQTQLSSSASRVPPAKVLALSYCLQKERACEDSIHPKQKRDLRKVRKQRREAQGVHGIKGWGPRNRHTHRDPRKLGKRNLETLMYMDMVNEGRRANSVVPKRSVLGTITHFKQSTRED